MFNPFFFLCPDIVFGIGLNSDNQSAIFSSVSLFTTSVSDLGLLRFRFKVEKVSNIFYFIHTDFVQIFEFFLSFDFCFFLSFTISNPSQFFITHQYFRFNFWVRIRFDKKVFINLYCFSPKSRHWKKGKTQLFLASCPRLSKIWSIYISFYFIKQIISNQMHYKSTYF